MAHEFQHISDKHAALSFQYLHLFMQKKRTVCLRLEQLCTAVSITDSPAICSAIKTQFSKRFAEGDKWTSNPLIVLSQAKLQEWCVIRGKANCIVNKKRLYRKYFFTINVIDGTNTCLLFHTRHIDSKIGALNRFMWFRELPLELCVCVCVKEREIEQN